MVSSAPAYVSLQPSTSFTFPSSAFPSSAKVRRCQAQQSGVWQHFFPVVMCTIYSSIGVSAIPSVLIHPVPRRLMRYIAAEMVSSAAAAVSPQPSTSFTATRFSSAAFTTASTKVRRGFNIWRHLFLLSCAPVLLVVQLPQSC